MSEGFPLLVGVLFAVLCLMAFWRWVLIAFVAAGLTVFGVGLVQVISWINTFT